MEDGQYQTEGKVNHSINDFPALSHDTIAPPGTEARARWQRPHRAVKGGGDRAKINDFSFHRNHQITSLRTELQRAASRGVPGRESGDAAVGPTSLLALVLQSLLRVRMHR